MGENHREQTQASTVVRYRKKNGTYQPTRSGCFRDTQNDNIMIGVSTRLAVTSSSRALAAARNSRIIGRRRMGGDAHGDGHHPHVSEP